MELQKTGIQFWLFVSSLAVLDIFLLKSFCAFNKYLPYEQLA